MAHNLEKKTFYCIICDYNTDHRTKYERHLETKKHVIAQRGIECCGLYYYDKHKWINHKKSKKHRLLHRSSGGDDSILSYSSGLDEDDDLEDVFCCSMDDGDRYIAKPKRKLNLRRVCSR